MLIWGQGIGTKRGARTGNPAFCMQRDEPCSKAQSVDGVARRRVLIALDGFRASKLRFRAAAAAGTHVETGLVARLRCRRGSLDEGWLLAAHLLLRHPDRSGDEGWQAATWLLFDRRRAYIPDLAGLIVVAEFARLAVVSVAIAEAAVVVIARRAVGTVAILADTILADTILADTILASAILAVAILRRPIRTVGAAIGIAAIRRIPVLAVTILTAAVLVAAIGAIVVAALLAAILASVLTTVLPIGVLPLAALSLGVLTTLAVAILVGLPIVAIVALATLRLPIGIRLVGRIRLRLWRRNGRDPLAR